MPQVEVIGVYPVRRATDIYVHDGTLLRVVEEPEHALITMHVELPILEDARREVFNFVEECVSFEKEISEGVSNAACNCFLENIAGDKELADVSKYLGPESREFFERWN